jgi:hypothetical protein
VTAEPFFSRTYAQARQRFLDAAEAQGLAVTSHRHPLLGIDGEILALDVARFGAVDAPRLLVISSACHGVEGYAGSAIQLRLLTDTAFAAAARAADVAVLYLHALNPYGFSWCRRATHENVDLNRNFHDFSKPLPENPAYDLLAHALVPARWPPSPAVEAGLMGYAAQHGMRALQEAITTGQHQHPEGLYYSGRNPTWSHRRLRQVLQSEGRACQRLAWIDLHTGLGPHGVGERILACPEDDITVARARRWWGVMTSIHDGSSSSTRLNGQMWTVAPDECPQAEFTGMALEFGTVPPLQVLAALRAEQWLENHPECDSALAASIKQQLRDVFCPDSPAWRDAVLAHGCADAWAALTGLAEP